MSAGVVIVEDNRAVRENLAALIRSDERLRLLGAYGSAEEALREVPALQPALAVMDINLPRMSGIECVVRLRNLLPRLLVLMLTVYEDDDSIFRALKAGANGYLVKRDAAEKLADALHEMSGGCPRTSPARSYNISTVASARQRRPSNCRRGNTRSSICW